jgi:hypothetical protein
MANIALALAFALAILLSPGKVILVLTVGEPVLQSLPPYQLHLLSAFVNYWIPAVLAYLILRLLYAESWLRPQPAIHILLGLANALLILYVSVRTFASTIQGGGASFVVISYAPFVIVPAWVMLGSGLVWLAVRSVQDRTEQPRRSRRPLGIGAVFGVATALGVPAAVAAWSLVVSEGAPFRLANEADTLFSERCKSAGESVFETPQDVDGIYLDSEGGEDFSAIVNGVYRSSGGGILGAPLVNSGYLRYFETQGDGVTGQYRRYRVNDWKGESTAELASVYGVFQRSLVADDDAKRLGVRGTEVTIRNLRNQETVATLVYYTNSRHRTICGHPGDGNFSVSAFIRKSLNLKRRFPSIFP